jgi:hypothetical protein
VRLRLGCAVACSGRATLRARGRTLAARRFAAPAGAVRVTLRLTMRDRRALTRAGRLRARLLLAPAGETWRLTLRR